MTLLLEELESYIQTDAPERGCKHKSSDRYVIDGKSYCRPCATEAAKCCRCGSQPVVAAVVLSAWRFGTKKRQDHVVRPLCAEHQHEAGEPRRFPGELKFFRRTRDGQLVFAVLDQSVTVWPPVMRFDPPPPK